MGAGEQHVVTSLDDVRLDHKHRYRWAARQAKGLRVIDAACGCGYGAAMLAEAGAASVLGLDINERALECALTHWTRPGVSFEKHDLIAPELPEVDLVVSIETVEHLPEPRPFLRASRQAAPRLLTSVPNEAVIPFSRRSFPYHQRHYTRRQLRELLEECGWVVEDWWMQKTKLSRVKLGSKGRTHVVQARRA